MKKRFLENLTLFLTLNLVIKPIYVFGIDRVVQNNVGAEIYGSYFPLFNLVLIFQIFLDLGIENFTRKEIAHHPGLIKRYFTSFLAIKVFLIAAFIALFSVIGLLLPHNQNEWWILFLLLVNQSMASFILYLRANMGGMQLFKLESVISVLDRFFMIMLVGVLLLMPLTRANFKIEWFVLAQTIAYAITLAFSLYKILQKTGKITIKLNILPYLAVLKQLGPYALLVLLMAFYYRIDSVFLRYLLPDGREQAGIYAHGFRILDFMSNYALIFALILLPTFSNMIRKKEDIAPLLKLATVVLFIPSFSFLISAGFYRKEIFGILYNEHTDISADTFLIFIISFAGICISYTYGALLTANSNLRQLNIMAAIAVLISVLSNLILIPRYKVLGAAASNALAQLFTIVFHMVVAKQKFHFKTDYKLLIKVACFLLFSVASGYLVSQTSINWFIGTILICAISLLFAFALKLIGISYISMLLSNKNIE